MRTNDPLQGIITSSAGRLSFTNRSGVLHSTRSPHTNDTIQGIWFTPLPKALAPETENQKTNPLIERLMKTYLRSEDDLSPDEIEQIEAIPENLEQYKPHVVKLQRRSRPLYIPTRTLLRHKRVS
jgi:hypothetical protein